MDVRIPNVPRIQHRKFVPSYLVNVAAFWLVICLSGCTILRPPLKAPQTAKPLETLPCPVEYLHMDLDLSLTQADIEAKRLCGQVTYRARARALDAGSRAAGLRVLPLNAVGLEIKKVELCKPGPAGETRYTPLRFRHADSHLLIDLGRRYPFDEEFSLRIDFISRPQEEALYFVQPDEDHPRRPVMIYTMSEPLMARHWFPCHDWPDTRWPSDIRIRVPQSYSAVSIGEPAGQPIDHADGTRTFHWRQSVPTDPHLIGIAIGDLKTLEFQASRGHSVRAYVLPGHEESGRFTFRRVPEMLDYYVALLGVDFPYSCYAHVSVEEHFHGGMEHAGFSMIAPTLLTTGARGDVPEDWSQYNYIAHMLAHMWFGGMVNYRDLRDAWLNEGFATYLDHLWRRRTEGEDGFVDRMYTSARALARWDVAGRDKPVRREGLEKADEVYEYDGGKVYFKGMWVLHMLSEHLGETQFWKAVGDYLTQQTSGNAGSEEFRAALGRSSGRNLKPYFDQWVYRDGLPRLDIDCTWDEVGHQARVTVRQRQLIDDHHPKFQFPIELWFRSNSEWHQHTIEVAEAVQTEMVMLRGEPDLYCTDPREVLLAAKHEIKPLEMWRRQVREGPTPLSRSVAVEHLAALRDEDACLVLRECLLDATESTSVRRRAAAALGRLRSEPALAALLDAGRLDWADDRTCSALIESLGGRTSSAEAYGAVRRFMGDDRSITVQAAAFSAISGFQQSHQDTEVVEMLTRAVRRPMSRYVRGAAIAALRRMLSPGALTRIAAPAAPDPEDTLELRQHLIDLVGALAAANPAERQHAIEFLLAQMEESRPTLRAAALRNLGAIGHEDVIETLRQRPEDGNESVRKTMAEALESIERRLNSGR